METITLAERIGWIHATAVTLPVDPAADLVACKWQLKQLIEQATEALELTRAEIHRGRRGSQAGSRG